VPSTHAATALIALLVFTVAGAGCSGGDAGPPPASVPGVPASNATEAPLLPTSADALPDFDFAAFEDLGSQLAGVPVVVNIWSSWCGPCKEEAPALASAALKYGGEVQFLGVDILDDREDAASFIRQHGWTYPSLFNHSGDIRDSLGFIGQPETVFYDASGHVVSTWIGPIPSDRLEQGIAAALSPEATDETLTGTAER